MKRVHVILGIAGLVLLVAGGVVFFSLLRNKQGQTAPVMEAAPFDFAAAITAHLQDVTLEPQFNVDGLATTVRLQVKNIGNAACEYKLLEYKLAGQPPRNAVIPFEIARLDPGQTEEIQLNFDNVPWEWTETDAKVGMSQKSSMRTLPPEGAAPDQKLVASFNGQKSSSNLIELPAEEFKRALPIFKQQYPKVRQSLSYGATANLENDLTMVTVTLSNKGDLPLLDFALRTARLGGNGDVAGEIDASSGASSSSEIKAGESKTFKVNFKNAPWDFSKSDSPFLNLVLEYAFRRADSITFKGATFQLEKINGPSEGKAFMGVSVKKPATASDAAKKK